MGFIGYRRESEGGSEEMIRIYLECSEKAGESTTACSFVVDVVFPPKGAACRLRGVESVLALKKFYKLVFSLEERAREHDNDWRSVMESPARLVEHLGYTRNARDFTGLAEPMTSRLAEAAEDPDRIKIGEGN